MARKSNDTEERRPRAAAAESEASATGVMQIATDKTVNSLLKAMENAKKETSSINGALGEKIKKAEDDKNLNRKALKAVASAAAMSDAHLYAFKVHFDAYWEHAKLNERMDKVAGMFAEEDKAAASEAIQNATESGNVADLGSRRARRARNVTETGGEASGEQEGAAAS